MKFLKSTHPLAKFFISLSCILPLFFSDNLFPPVFYLGFTTFLLIVFDIIPIKRLLLIFIFFLPFSISIFLLNALYGKSVSGSQTLILGHFIVYHDNLVRGIALGARAYSLGVISVSWVFAIDFSRMVKGLMQSFRLSPRIGYSLFVGINAIPFIREEFQRIRQAKKVRGIRRPMVVAILVNILSQSIRFSEHASLSMISRALGPTRTYYRDERVTRKDYEIIGIFYGLNITLVILFLLANLYHFGM